MLDVPCAHTMYLDKPLAGHNLMQAIARVNRVYGEKPGGLIVDLLGLADQFADALATYAQASGKNEEAFKNVQDEAVPAMRSAFEKLRAFFHGFDYSAALEAPPQSVLNVYVRAIDYVLAQSGESGEASGRADVSMRENPGRQRLRKIVKELSAAFALAVPRRETDEVAPHLAFAQRVVAMIQKRLVDQTSGNGRQRQRDVDAAVRQVIGGAVDAGEVIDLFAAAGSTRRGWTFFPRIFCSASRHWSRNIRPWRRCASWSMIKCASPSGRISCSANTSAKHWKTR